MNSANKMRRLAISLSPKQCRFLFISSLHRVFVLVCALESVSNNLINWLITIYIVGSPTLLPKMISNASKTICQLINKTCDRNCLLSHSWWLPRTSLDYYSARSPLPSFHCHLRRNAETHRHNPNETVITFYSFGMLRSACLLISHPNKSGMEPMRVAIFKLIHTFYVQIKRYFYIVGQKFRTRLGIAWRISTAILNRMGSWVFDLTKLAGCYRACFAVFASTA